MAEFLLLCDVLGSVDGRALAASHHRALVDDLCTDTGYTSPAKEGGVVGRVLEPDMVEERSAGDVNVGVGVGNFLIFRQDTRGHFTKGADDFEILIVGAKTLAEGKLNGGSWVLCTQDGVAKAEHRALGCQFTSNEGLHFSGVAGTNAKDKFEAGLVCSAVKRAGEAFMAPAMDAKTVAWPEAMALPVNVDRLPPPWSMWSTR